MIFVRLFNEFSKHHLQCKNSILREHQDTEETSPGSVHDAGCLGLVRWDGPGGWYGEGGGRRVQDGEHVYT